MDHDQPAGPHPADGGPSSPTCKSSRARRSSTLPPGWGLCLFLPRPPIRRRRRLCIRTRNRCASSSKIRRWSSGKLFRPTCKPNWAAPRQAADPRAMPLQDFIAETLQIFKSQPEAREKLRGKGEAPSLRGSHWIVRQNAPDVGRIWSSTRRIRKRGAEETHIRFHDQYSPCPVVRPT